MKLKAKLKRTSIEDNKNLVTFELSSAYYLRSLNELNTDDDYSISITKIKSKRSLQQNKYLWSLLGEIALKMNYDNQAEDVYIMLIEKYGLKFDFIGCLPEAVDNLKSVFRFIKLVEERDKMNIYKCYYGSSHFNKEEMSVLIDGTLQLAHDCGIDTLYWRDLLN